MVTARDVLFDARTEVSIRLTAVIGVAYSELFFCASFSDSKGNLPILIATKTNSRIFVPSSIFLWTPGIYSVVGESSLVGLQLPVCCCAYLSIEASSFFMTD